jgi:hypothetical protein
VVLAQDVAVARKGVVAVVAEHLLLDVVVRRTQVGIFQAAREWGKQRVIVGGMFVFFAYSIPSFGKMYPMFAN